MRSYIKVTFDTLGEAYQEILAGEVVRYLDASGTEMFLMPPAGEGSRVIDANPASEEWMAVTPVDPLATIDTAALEAELARRGMP